MKVYIITREPFPNGMAATNRIICYAKAIISQGVDCQVLIYTRTEVYGKTPKNTIREGLFEGVYYKYIGNTPLRNRFLIVRKLNDLLDCIMLYIYLFNSLKSGDIVFGYTGFMLNLNFIFKIVKKKAAKYVQELCELPFGTSIETKLMISKRKKCQLKQFPYYDAIIAISDSLVEYANKYKSDNCKVCKIPILVDVNKYIIPDLSNKAEIPYIFHSGTMSQQKDGYLDLLEAFGRAIKRIPFSIRFISTGKLEGSRHEKEIKELIVKYSLQSNIIFTGYLSNEQLKDYLSMASFVVINKLTNNQNKYCFSTKLGEYMAASKPIIITNVGEAINWLTNEKDAYIIPPNNIEDLTEAIVRMFTDNELRNYLSLNARATCKKSFDYRKYGYKLVSLFN